VRARSVKSTVCAARFFCALRTAYGLDLRSQTHSREPVLTPAGSRITRADIALEIATSFWIAVREQQRGDPIFNQTLAKGEEIYFLQNVRLDKVRLESLDCFKAVGSTVKKWSPKFSYEVWAAFATCFICHYRICIVSVSYTLFRFPCRLALSPAKKFLGILPFDHHLRNNDYLHCEHLRALPRVCLLCLPLQLLPAKQAMSRSRLHHGSVCSAIKDSMVDPRSSTAGWFKTHSETNTEKDCIRVLFGFPP